ncbi:MAG: hypothetical protein RR971_05510, partial [Alistipes sp.]
LVVAFLTLVAVVVLALIPVGGVGVKAMGEVPSLLGGFIMQWQHTFPLAAKMLSGLLCVFSGVVVGRLTLRYTLYAVQTHLAIPLYGIFACSVLLSDAFTITALASTLFTLSIYSYNASFRSRDYGFGNIFRASLYLGLIPLIYTPAVVLTLVLPLVAILGERSGRELFVAMVGYLLPFFLVCYVNWGLGGAFSTPIILLCEFFVTHNSFSILALAPLTWIQLGVLFLLFAGAVVCYFLNLYSASSKSRSILSFQLALSLIAGSMLFVPCASSVAMGLVAIPTAVVVPLLFVRLKPALASNLYLGLIALCLVAFFHQLQ